MKVVAVARQRTQKRVNPVTAFGVMLRQERQKRGYSQESLAHATGYHRNYIGQLERGEKSPSLTALFNFAKTLNAKASALVALVERNMEITPRE